MLPVYRSPTSSPAIPPDYIPSVPSDTPIHGMRVIAKRDFDDILRGSNRSPEDIAADVEARIHHYPNIGSVERTLLWSYYTERIFCSDLKKEEKQALVAPIISRIHLSLADSCQKILTSRRDATQRANWLIHLHRRVGRLSQLRWINKSLTKKTSESSEAQRLVHALITAPGRTPMRLLQRLCSERYRSLIPKLYPLLEQDVVWSANRPVLKLIHNLLCASLNTKNTVSLLEPLFQLDRLLEAKRARRSTPVVWKNLRKFQSALTTIDHHLETKINHLRQSTNTTNALRALLVEHRVDLVLTLGSDSSTLLKTWSQAIHHQLCCREQHSLDSSRYFIQDHLYRLAQELIKRDAKISKQLLLEEGGWVHLERLTHRLVVLRGLGAERLIQALLAQHKGGLDEYLAYLREIGVFSSCKHFLQYMHAIEFTDHKDQLLETTIDLIEVGLSRKEPEARILLNKSEYLIPALTRWAKNPDEYAYMLTSGDLGASKQLEEFIQRISTSHPVLAWDLIKNTPGLNLPDVGAIGQGAVIRAVDKRSLERLQEVLGCTKRPVNRQFTARAIALLHNSQLADAELGHHLNQLALSEVNQDDLLNLFPGRDPVLLLKSLPNEISQSTARAFLSFVASTPPSKERLDQALKLLCFFKNLPCDPVANQHPASYRNALFRLGAFDSRKRLHRYTRLIDPIKSDKKVVAALSKLQPQQPHRPSNPTEICLSLSNPTIKHLKAALDADVPRNKESALAKTALRLVESQVEVVDMLIVSPLAPHLANRPTWIRAAQARLRHLILSGENSKAYALFDSLSAHTPEGALKSHEMAIHVLRGHWQAFFRQLASGKKTHPTRWVPILLSLPSRPQEQAINRYFHRLKLLSEHCQGHKGIVGVLLANLTTFPSSLRSRVDKACMSALIALIECLVSLGPQMRLSKPAQKGRRQIGTFQPSSDVPEETKLRIIKGLARTAFLPGTSDADCIEGWTCLRRIAEAGSASPQDFVVCYELAYKNLISQIKNNRMDPKLGASLLSTMHPMKLKVDKLLKEIPAADYARISMLVQRTHLSCYTRAVRNGAYEWCGRLSAAIQALLAPQALQRLESTDHKSLQKGALALLKGAELSDIAWEPASLAVSLALSRKLPGYKKIGNYLCNQTLAKTVERDNSQAIQMAVGVVTENISDLDTGAVTGGLNRVAKRLQTPKWVSQPTQWIQLAPSLLQAYRAIQKPHKVIEFLKKSAASAGKQQASEPLASIIDLAIDARLNAEEHLSIYRAAAANAHSAHKAYIFGFAMGLDTLNFIAHPPWPENHFEKHLLALVPIFNPTSSNKVSTPFKQHDLQAAITFLRYNASKLIDDGYQLNQTTMTPAHIVQMESALAKTLSDTDLLSPWAYSLQRACYDLVFRIQAPAGPKFFYAYQIYKRLHRHQRPTFLRRSELFSLSFGARPNEFFEYEMREQLVQLIRHARGPNLNAHPTNTFFEQLQRWHLELLNANILIAEETLPRIWEATVIPSVGAYNLTRDQILTLGRAISSRLQDMLKTSPFAYAKLAVMFAKSLQVHRDLEEDALLLLQAAPN